MRAHRELCVVWRIQVTEMRLGDAVKFAQAADLFEMNVVQWYTATRSTRLCTRFPSRSLVRCSIPRPTARTSVNELDAKQVHHIPQNYLFRIHALVMLNYLSCCNFHVIICFVTICYNFSLLANGPLCVCTELCTCDHGVVGATSQSNSN